MPKNQLFKNIPDLQIVQSVLEAFGLDNIEDTRLFTKEHMKDVETVQKLTELSETLQDYYIPCKSKKYLTDLNEIISMISHKYHDVKHYMTLTEGDDKYIIRFNDNDKICFIVEEVY